MQRIQQWASIEKSISFISFFTSFYLLTKTLSATKHIFNEEQTDIFRDGVSGKDANSISVSIKKAEGFVSPFLHENQINAMKIVF